ncbi:MAG: hypothetical protein M3Z23_19035 [Acidobacteriota bacterium]|nr:hypothetical protein [Acidobacteriota bacterium]
MNSFPRASLWMFGLALWLSAQQSTTPQNTPQGLAADWDISKTLRGISAHIAQLQPILEQIRPKEWIAKGAPDTYLEQWQSSVSQANSLAASAQTLARHPEKLPDSLQILFRIQSLDSSMNSLKEGLRKYQNPALADLLDGVAAENTVNRDKLQQYVLDLATQKEQQFQVADREAQRCRESLSKEVPGGRRPR